MSNEENEGLMPADWPWTDSTRSTQPIGRPLRPIDEAAAVSTHDLADNFYALGVLPNKVDVLSFLLGAQFDAAKKAVAARCISSDGHSTYLQPLFSEDDAVVVVLRHRTPLRAEVFRQVTDCARAVTGTEYCKNEAMAVVARTMRRTGSRQQFCSRLAAQAYASPGLAWFRILTTAAPRTFERADTSSRSRRGAPRFQAGGSLLGNQSEYPDADV
ncbi:hypothetical protein ACFKHW_30255 [Bradyrhizobium lupini]|uniref:hypothetical protein n=1 Tax=Rhizobium lupini TaxID=136996 RepID=UPI00366DDB2E